MAEQRFRLFRLLRGESVRGVGMTTRAQVAEAHRLSDAHRLAMIKLAKVSEAVAFPLRRPKFLGAKGTS
jgi:hypothetical protein